MHVHDFQPVEVTPEALAQVQPLLRLMGVSTSRVSGLSQCCTCGVATLSVCPEVPDAREVVGTLDDPFGRDPAPVRARVGWVFVRLSFGGLPWSYSY